MRLADLLSDTDERDQAPGMQSYRPQTETQFCSLVYAGKSRRTHRRCFISVSSSVWLQHPASVEIFPVIKRLDSLCFYFGFVVFCIVVLS